MDMHITKWIDEQCQAGLHVTQLNGPVTKWVSHPPEDRTKILEQHEQDMKRLGISSLE